MKTTLTLTISIIIAISMIIILLGRLNAAESKSKSLAQTIQEQQAEINYRKTHEGKLIADKQAAEVRASDLAKAYPELANILTNQMDIKLKNLQSVLRAEFQVVGQGNSTVIHNHYDSTGQYPQWTLKAQDGYLDFEADVYDSLRAPYRYTYHDTLVYAFHFKRKWAFGNKQLYGSGMLRNQNSKITNSTAVQIKDFRDKRFGVGPYVGYGTSGASVGISVHYSVVRF